MLRAWDQHVGESSQWCTHRLDHKIFRGAEEYVHAFTIAGSIYVCRIYLCYHIWIFQVISTLNWTSSLAHLLWNYEDTPRVLWKPTRDVEDLTTVCMHALCHAWARALFFPYILSVSHPFQTAYVFPRVANTTTAIMGKESNVTNDVSVCGYGCICLWIRMYLFVDILFKWNSLVLFLCEMDAPSNMR